MPYVKAEKNDRLIAALSDLVTMQTPTHMACNVYNTSLAGGILLALVTIDCQYIHKQLKGRKSLPLRGYLLEVHTIQLQTLH